MTEDNAEEDAVIITKRVSKGRNLPKQPNTRRMAVKQLLNPQRGLIIDFSKALPIQKRMKPKSRKPDGKKAQKARNREISDFVGRYNVFSELANVTCRLNSGKLLCGDAEEAK